MENNYQDNHDGTTTIFVGYHGRTLETSISTAKFELADAYPNTWFTTWDKGSRTYYIYGKVQVKGKKMKVYLHRIVMQCPTGKQVHHRNNNGLDNTDENLENVTREEHRQKERPKDQPILGDSNGKTHLYILEKPRLNEHGEYLWFDVEVNGMFFGSYQSIVEANLTINIANEVVNESVSDEYLINYLVVGMKHDVVFVKRLIKKIRKFVRVTNPIEEEIAG